MSFEKMGASAPQRLKALGPAPPAELLHVPYAPRLRASRSDRIGEFWSHPESRTFAELLIDCEDKASGQCWSTFCGSRQGGGDARTSGVSFRFLLELSKIERQSECTGDIARG
jgi:hypothetical protein